MIKLNLREIFKRERRFCGSYRLNPEDIKLPPDAGKLDQPVDVYVEITREKGGYRVYMELEGSVLLECSRCLTIYRKDLSRKESIKIEPYPNREVSYLKSSELEVSFYEDEENFDLTELVREQILLSLPTKPLCSPNCAIALELDSKGTTLGDLVWRQGVL
ncbi:MAG: YceD family protein [Aquificaceae bacterium]|nr:YceD family protein [Aquificaceae bacterium]MCX8059661.1 YceD family protein [Aquificaceae bacterium]MDW8097147.1 YceD family protein [Aquificaceae bacterium]